MHKPEWLTSMEAVLEVLNEGVVITNENHRILFANSLFVEMTGIPKQNLIGFDPSQFYSPQESDFVAQQIDVEFRDGHNRYAFVLPWKDGGRLPVIISSQALENSGRQFGIVTFTDISEQMRVTEELRSSNAKLQQRQMEIDEDLRLAARVHRSLAPKSLVWDRLSIDSFYHAVHSVGGDFALVNSQDGEHISLLLCDVSGHGIGSALVANRIYSETMGHLRTGMPFIDMFAELNRFLIEEIGAGMFITVAAVSIDTHLRRMVFAGDSKTGTTVWNHSYSHDEPVNGKDVSAVVAAMGRNVQNGLSEVLSGLDQYFSAQASVASTAVH
jgi:PAS domain S-box-containing protein